ncbi:zinc carboxypeptidase-like [Coccinella septempunctata]|uniref:zinc carboxypeptidase-like n=1 Tax=Coccinella septempunctata TaxID=41139 RepID=UPI001D088FF9|nr:zinc carboxypeptidase-like [Coccinella septempunctata]XP_044756778.1 zinc carboxypeptidase-like [Coccinella septempunctata]
MNILVLVLLGSCIACKINYQRYRVYRTHPETHKDLQLLKQFVESVPAMDFWNSPNDFETGLDIMVPPELKKEFENFLCTRNIDSKVLIDDVQNLMDKEVRGWTPRCAFGWTQYPTLAQIEAWLYSLPSLYKRVKVITVGNTFEGRNILGAHLSYSRKNKNRAVFIEANMHGREWITSAATTFIFNELLSSQDPEIRRIAESYDWYFVPVANPDGFVYSHEQDRNWYRTRQNHGICVGADAERNWDHHWSEHESIMWTTCTSTYPGPRPFSETCTKTLSQYISTIGGKLVAYLSFHSYGQVLGIPYAHTPDPLDNYDLTYSIGLKVVKSIAERYGTEYKVGNIYNLKGPAGGFSVDWVKATFQTPLVYHFYLRDNGTKGYLLPPDQIVPTGLETLDGIVTMLNAFDTGSKCSPLDYD